jgi:hypothetical protein
MLHPVSGLLGFLVYRIIVGKRGKTEMSEDYWKKLTKRHEEMLAEERYLEELLQDKTRQLKKSIKDKRAEIKALEELIEETRAVYQVGFLNTPPS